MNMQAGALPFFDGPQHLTQVDPTEAQAVSEAVEAVIAWPVLGVTLIEGRDVASLRVHFRDGSLIVTRRDDQSVLKREAKTLNKLWKAGAPVPRFIALSGDYLIEEDPGGRSLSASFVMSDGARRLQLMEAAFASLYQVKQVAQKAKFRKPPPLFQSDPDWLERFVASPLFLSEFLGVAPPPIDYNAVLRSLKLPSARFVKWGASPCNAHICKEGGLTWFDWSASGLSAGYEDIGFLISDENWPPDPTASLALYRRFQPDWTPQSEAHLCTFAALRICHRLLSIGQGNPDGITIQVIRSLVAHGVAFAGRARLLRGAASWFETLGIEEIWREKLAPPPASIVDASETRD